ncbi:MAG: hypothetical protein RLZZ584_415 [Pseudomonadota bacterium]|jgi:uncharacterized protein (TIGR00251 family)
MTRPTPVLPRSSGPAAFAPVAAAWPGWLRVNDSGATLDLALVPNARRNEWAGLHDGALRLRLAAPPVDGAANAALLRWLADTIGLRLSELELVAGATSRRKRVALHCTHDALRRWVDGLPPELLDGAVPPRIGR